MDHFLEINETRKIKQIKEQNNKELIDQAVCINCSCIGNILESIYCESCHEVFCSNECKAKYKINDTCSETEDKCRYSLNTIVLTQLNEKNLLFSCPNEGCNLMMNYFEYFKELNHINQCEYRRIVCKECKNVILFKNIKSHTSWCQYCSKTFLKEREKAHYDQECEYWVEYCEKCLSPKDKMNLGEHSDKICMIQSKRRKQLLSFTLSLLFRQKMFCEECQCLLTCNHKVKKNFSCEEIFKLLSREYITARDNDLNNLITVGANEQVNFKVCEGCNRILCQKEFSTYNNDCLKCNEKRGKHCSNPEHCKIDKTTQQHFCETHHKYQFEDPRSCGHCNRKILLCCGLPCLSCRLSFCNICTEAKDQKGEILVFCIRCEICLNCINTKENLNRKHLMKKSCLDSLKQQYKAEELKNKYNLIKQTDQIHKYQSNDQMEEIDNLGVIDETASSFMNRRGIRKGKDNYFDDLEEIYKEQRNRRRVSYDYTSIPKQKCHICGHFNMFYEVSCKNCKQFL